MKYFWRPLTAWGSIRQIYTYQLWDHMFENTFRQRSEETLNTGCTIFNGDSVSIVYLCKFWSVLIRENMAWRFESTMKPVLTDPLLRDHPFMKDRIHKPPYPIIFNPLSRPWLFYLCLLGGSQFSLVNLRSHHVRVLRFSLKYYPAYRKKFPLCVIYKLYTCTYLMSLFTIFYIKLFYGNYGSRTPILVDIH